jgi:glutamine synthetase
MHASFLPKPLQGKPGSGLHVNMSLVKDGKNLFDTENTPAGEAEWFIAGILDHVAEITAVLNPLTNSYARFGEYEAPRYISWSRANRSQLVRIPSVKGEYNRMELRSPDPTCNPYLAFALLLEAGMDGIDRHLPLPPAADLELYNACTALSRLPSKHWANGKLWNKGLCADCPKA